MDADKRTRFPARRGFALVVLVTWLVSVLACARSAGEPSGMISTSWAMQLTAVALPTQTPVSPDIEEPPLASAIIQLPTSTPEAPAAPLNASPPAVESPSNGENEKPVRLYYAQAGDTIPALAARFSVDPESITSPEALPEEGLITPNQLLILPDVLGEVSPETKLLPDSEIVFSPSAIDFDVKTYVDEAGGYLSSYKQYLSNGWHTGAEVVERVAIENSVNPRLLLSILEYQSNWVHGKPASLAVYDYPIGNREFINRGLYRQLSWAVQQLAIGYYGWRGGLVTELNFSGSSRQHTMRIAPDLNAGTVALQYLFSQLYDQRKWGGALYAPESLPKLHEEMFGNPWLRAQTVEPLYPTNLTQPELELPFEPGVRWSYTGGPHSAWGPNGALAALDFAPGALEHGCVASPAWVIASAAGKVVRSGDGVVTLDMDGDGFEQTGWGLLYLHIETKNRVAAGTWMDVNDRIGHPSCEGGVSTGTHVHIARKYNGEWILADGAMPFVLSGWRAHNGEKPYEGMLTKGDQVIPASVYGTFESRIIRQRLQP